MSRAGRITPSRHLSTISFLLFATEGRQHSFGSCQAGLDSAFRSRYRVRHTFSKLR